MNFEEHAAKPLLAAAGIAVPRGRLATTPEEAGDVAAPLGPVVVKAQVPAGKRGKAGGILPADGSDQATGVAAAILGMEIRGHVVERVFVEERAEVAREFYCAVLDDPDAKGPRVLFSPDGGMDIEEIAADHPERLRQRTVDIRHGFSVADAQSMLDGLDLDGSEGGVAETLARLYACFVANDAELLEINPLAVLASARLVALDCKFVLDDSAVKRRPELAARGSPERLTGLEARGAELGLRYIELDGDVGVLANGAGLTMTTMDVIAHHGGRPANFLEIGGEAYTKAEPALDLVLSNCGVKSLVVNFCGAFARTEVMTEGVVAAIEEVRPRVPLFWSVHGTGSAQAHAILRERLDVTPYSTMDEAIAAAVAAAREASA